jgi:hypothetical protein
LKACISFLQSSHKRFIPTIFGHASTQFGRRKVVPHCPHKIIFQPVTLKWKALLSVYQRRVARDDNPMEDDQIEGEGEVEVVDEVEETQGESMRRYKCCQPALLLPQELPLNRLQRNILIGNNLESLVAEDGDDGETRPSLLRTGLLMAGRSAGD